MTHPREDILSISPDSLAAWLRDAKEPVYRLDQILRWLYREYADSFDRMTDLPESLRGKLSASFAVTSLAEIERLTSSDGRTEKFLFGLDDGEQIESVSMQERNRLTFCISSQAGCALDCQFCATGAGGIRRNLTLGEILGQVTALARAEGGLRNVVFMGMGEPLLNCDAVLPALEALIDPRRFGLGPRHVTISTAGITPGIKRLAECAARPNLALSLNSPFDDQRSQLMPINRKYPLAQVLDACEEYSGASRHRLLIEYVLIHGVNISLAAAKAVADIAERLRARVNLIPFNTVEQTGFKPPTPDEVMQFKAVLVSRHIEAIQRFRRGVEIAAGCGQLRGKHADPSRAQDHPLLRETSRGRQ